MISLKPLIALLSQKPADFNGIWFRRVGTSEDMAQIRPEALPLPACWIIRKSEKARHAGLREEIVTFMLDIIIGVENARSHEPGETDEMLLQLRMAVNRLLLGKKPMGEHEEINYEGGESAGITERDTYWKDTYSFKALITNYESDPLDQAEIIEEMEDGQL